MILYLAADLLWASRIKGTADHLGIPCRPARSVEMLDARLAEGGVAACILDLEAQETAFAILERLRGASAGDREKSVRVVAFGPHVRKDLFDHARAAGAEEALPRSVFDRDLATILRRLAGSPA